MGRQSNCTFGSGLPAGVTSDFLGDATSVTIKDDDRPTSLTVSFDVGIATVAEGRRTTIDVRLSEDPEREIVIPITAAGLGGATSDDYSGVPSSVTFGADQCYYRYTNEEYTCYEKSKRIRLMAVQDSDDDEDEAVRLSIGSPLPAGVTLGGGRPVKTVRITEGNDSGEVAVGLAQVGVSVSAQVSYNGPGGEHCAGHQQRGVAVAAFGHRVRRLQRHPRVGGGHVEPVHSLGGRPGHVAQSEGHL